MAVQILDSAGSNKLAIDATGAVKMTQRPPYVGSNGAYRVCATSGLITTVAAGTASAGHLFAARWSHATKLCLITKLRAKWWTVSGFTAAQEVGLDCFMTRSYSVSHSAQTAVTLTGNSMKKLATHGTTTFADIRIANTGALTNGTHTLDSNPIAQSGFAELAAAATVPKGRFLLDVIDEAINGHPLILTQNEGIVIRNTVLMGAGGTARIAVEMDWLEVDAGVY